MDGLLRRTSATNAAAGEQKVLACHHGDGGIDNRGRSNFSGAQQEEAREGDHSEIKSEAGSAWKERGRREGEGEIGCDEGLTGWTHEQTREPRRQ